MSVIEKNKIDAMGKSKTANELILMIADHLDWENEYEHLIVLQDKINSYIGFIEARDFRETYPTDNFSGYIIEIHFQYEVSENCIKFLDTVANQTEELGVKIRVNIV
jgi:hypothetical protein